MNYYSRPGIIIEKTKDNIVSDAANFLKLDREKILSKTRLFPYPQVRFVCMYILYYSNFMLEEKKALQEIASEFGYNGDSRHCVVIHALSTVEDLKCAEIVHYKDKPIRKLVEYLCDKYALAQNILYS